MRNRNIVVTKLFAAVTCQSKYDIDSYHLKLALMKMESSDTNQHDDEDRLIKLLCKLFTTLHESFKNNYMPHPYITNMNVFEEDKNNEIKAISGAFLGPKCCGFLLFSFLIEKELLEISHFRCASGYK